MGCGRGHERFSTFWTGLRLSPKCWDSRHGSIENFPWFTGVLAPDPGTEIVTLVETGYPMTGDVENIIELLGPREVIGRAIGLLMVQDGLSRDAAFERLVQRSSGSHRRVRETAAEIVEQRRGD